MLLIIHDDELQTWLVDYSKKIFFSEQSSEFLDISRPKLIFCQNDRANVIKEAIAMIQLDATIITFEESVKFISFKKFLKKYEKSIVIDDFV